MREQGRYAENLVDLLGKQEYNGINLTGKRGEG